MRRVMSATLTLFAVSVMAQDAADYTPSENPFQAEYAFTVGRPLVLRVAIGEVRFDSLTLAPVAEATPAGEVNCTATVAGNNVSARKANVVVVLLLEDGDGKSLEKVPLGTFKVKAGREFSEAQPVRVLATSLAAAARLYLFIRVET